MEDPQTRLRGALERFVAERGAPESLISSVPTGWESHGDLILLPKDSMSGWSSHAGHELWVTVARALGCQRLARKGDIVGVERRPQVEMLLGEDTWVTHREHGIDYSFDVTKSMFSAGNLSERGRMGEFDCVGETVLDLYAGIGYYTLPLLVRAGAANVHACEWSEDAVNALKHNLDENGVAERCTVHFGDNRLLVADGGSAGVTLGSCDRVVLGLLPSSEEGWPLALAALKPGGGWLHLHGNAPRGGEEEWASSVVRKMIDLGAGDLTLERLVKVKWYAPHIRHCVLDLKIR